MRLLFLILILLIFTYTRIYSQPVPTVEENIPYMITFGKDADQSWGDDDFCQIFFFVVPKSTTIPFYLRIFDPDTGGEIDEARGQFDTKIKFSVYGGNDCFSNKDATNINPVGEYDSGNLLASKTFGVSNKYDNKWYAMGPFNPAEGEFNKNFNAYVFKIIAQGIEGNDGNLYKYFFSTKSNKNIPIDGGSTFTYEYSFRLSEKANHISHIYPYIDDKVISIKIYIFDWDNEGYVRLITNSKKGEYCKLSGEGFWVENIFPVVDEEKNSTFDIQLIKPKSEPLKTNNGVLYITNQYNELLPFYNSPIGGIPAYKYKIDIVKH